MSELDEALRFARSLDLEYGAEAGGPITNMARALLALAEQRTAPPKRNAHVERMLASIKRQGDYHEDVPKHWMREDHGQEYALLRYIEELEAYVGAAAKETNR